METVFDKPLDTELSGKQNATDNTLTTTAKTVVGAINENASGISSNSSAITNLQSDVGLHVVSTLSDFLSLFTENDKVIRVKSTGASSSSLINHNNRNAIITAWKNGDWIYYNGEDFEGIYGTGYIQISTQRITYKELATTEDASACLKSGTNNIGNIIAAGYITGSGNYITAFIPVSTGGKTVTSITASASSNVYTINGNISFSSAPTITAVETTNYGLRIDVTLPSTQTAANRTATIYLVSLSVVCS